MKVKFSLMPVKLLKSPKSLDGAYYSHVPCDVCRNQGIMYEGIAYTGQYGDDLVRFNTTYSKWLRLDILEKQQGLRRYGNTFGKDIGKSMMYYLCSEECANMLILQLEDNVVPNN